MKNQIVLFIATFILFTAGCQKETVNLDSITEEEMSISDINKDNLNPEAKKYYGNMADFINLTTSNIDNHHASRLKSASLVDGDTTVNSIFEEFLNLEIEDDNGNVISFFELDSAERQIFLDQWITINAYDMTPKLEDSIYGEDFEEYIKVQNDGFDEAMKEFEEADSGRSLKSNLATYSSNEVYGKISQKIQEKVRIKSESYAEAYHTTHPEVSNQLQKHADKGNILINMPGSVWLMSYLNYYNPAAIPKYVGIGKYPPGHVSIIRQNGSNISNNTSTRGFAISA